MRHSELVVLALIGRGPRHGYEIHRELETMRAQSWARVGRSTVYKVLQRLEERGELARHTAREGNRPERHVYELTAVGRERLAELAGRALASSEPAYSDRVVGGVLADVALARPAEALEEALARAEATLERVDAVASGGASELGADVLRFTRAVAEAEAAFLRARLDRLRPGCSLAEEGLPYLRGAARPEDAGRAEPAATDEAG